MSARTDFDFGGIARALANAASPDTRRMGSMLLGMHDAITDDPSEEATRADSRAAAGVVRVHVEAMTAAQQHGLLIDLAAVASICAELVRALMAEGSPVHPRVRAAFDVSLEKMLK